MNMDNIKKQLEKLNTKKWPVILAAVIWAAFCAISMLLCIKNGFVGYESNDDFYMNMISSGMYGSPDAHNIYNNIILGYVYSLLYRLSNTHNWNTLIQLGVILVSYIAFGVWNICKNKIVKGFSTSLIFFWCTFETLVCRMNYSKTGVLALGVGFVLLSQSVDTDSWREVKNRLLRILSYLFIIGGSLFRKETLYASLPFLALLGLYIILKYKKDSILRLVPFAILGVVLALCLGVNFIAYHSNDAWKHYERYNEARTELIDFSMPAYNQYADEYSKIGLSEVDYYFFKSWRYADEQVFSQDKLNQIISFRDASKEKVSFAKAIENNILGAKGRSQEKILLLSFLLTLLALALSVAISSRKYLFYQLMVFVLCNLEMLALLYKGRIAERAFYLPVILAYIVMMFFVDSVEDTTKNKLAVALFMILFTVSIYHISGIKYMGDNFKDAVYDKASAQELLGYTADNKDCLYAMDIITNDLLLSKSFSPFDNFSEVSHENIALMGGWLVPSPVATKIIRPFGDEYNLFRILAENESAFWISINSPELDILCDYMRMNYGKEVTIVDRVGVYYICSFAK